MSLVLVESEHSVRYPLLISRARFRTDIGYFGRHEEKVKNPEIRKPTSKGQNADLQVRVKATSSIVDVRRMLTTPSNRTSAPDGQFLNKQFKLSSI